MNDDRYDWSKVDPATVRGICDEAHWDELVRSIGGKRFDDILPNAHFENADYIFEEWGVVAELKILENDVSSSPEFQEKASKLKEKYANVPPVDPLPDDMQKDYYNLFREPLVRVARKANRQIRETKGYLNKPEWMGILICINDNFRSVSPQYALKLIANATDKPDFKHIDGINYHTNHLVHLHGHPHPTFFGADLAKPVSYRPKVHEFNNFLGAAWFEYREKKMGPFMTNESRPASEPYKLSTIKLR